MTTPEKLSKLVESAEIFEKKEIMVTVTKRECDEMYDWLCDTESTDTIEWGFIPKNIGYAMLRNGMDLRSFTYLGVRIHFNVV